MCPLRIILIFLSATLAGFFLIRNINSPTIPQNDVVSPSADEEIDSKNAVSPSSRFCSALGKGFWTCVDMASGRYLWRNLVSSSASSETKLRAD